MKRAHQISLRYRWQTPISRSVKQENPSISRPEITPPSQAAVVGRLRYTNTNTVIHASMFSRLSSAVFSRKSEEPGARGKKKLLLSVLCFFTTIFAREDYRHSGGVRVGQILPKTNIN
uniref:(northern house mosquito) hypothetical protein n=1 Tax=Culex pipiens TaxID=7175 RepID=A0A8D8CK44_CULPI